MKLTYKFTELKAVNKE